MRIVDRIYPDIQLHTQASGRHSTVDPPLAQLPEDLRRIVLPDEGTIEWGYDWDSIELRIVASEADDKPLQEAFAQGHDVHTLSLCEVFRIPYPPEKAAPWREVERESPLDVWRRQYLYMGKKDTRRTFSKRFVYRLLYGARPDTCMDIPGAVHLGLDGRGLMQASENWLNAHPAIRRFQEKCRQDAMRTGMIFSFGGRRRTLVETGEEAARQAMNHPMQGGCTDVYEDVIYEIDKAFYPVLSFRWGMHDSHKWQMAMDDYHADCDRGFPRLNEAARIVQAPRTINGIDTSFPATFYVLDDQGNETPWVPTT